MRIQELKRHVLEQRDSIAVTVLASDAAGAWGRREKEREKERGDREERKEREEI